MNRFIPKPLAAAGVAVMMVLGLSACSTPTATSSDMCAYTEGNGQKGADARVRNVYLPNEEIKVALDEKVFFFPCNSRNLRLTLGTTDVNAKGEAVGPVETYTSAGTKVIVDVRMAWQLNQDRDVLKNVFIPFCKKYHCASSDPDVRNANFSTPGWSNGLLGENATPAFITSTRNVLREFDDRAWTDTGAVEDEISIKIAASFEKYMRATVGTTSDLFCGSGETSGWTGEAPGQGTFNCSDVRVQVENIQPADKGLLELKARQAKAVEQKVTNVAELEAAKAKYGDDASQVLGDLDKINACAVASKECNIYIGTAPVMGSTSGSEAAPVVEE